MTETKDILRTLDDERKRIFGVWDIPGTLLIDRKTARTALAALQQSTATSKDISRAIDRLSEALLNE